jgi:hypothetical protein
MHGAMAAENALRVNCAREDMKNLWLDYTTDFHS